MEKSTPPESSCSVAMSLPGRIKKSSALVKTEMLTLEDPKTGGKGRPCYECPVCKWNSKGANWEDAEGALLSHLETCGQNEAACQKWREAKENWSWTRNVETQSGAANPENCSSNSLFNALP